eukprot:COSAG06_NODE_4197_length_4485_cov_7.345645_1_plen_113_part_10
MHAGHRAFEIIGIDYGGGRRITGIHISYVLIALHFDVVRIVLSHARQETNAQAAERHPAAADTRCCCCRVVYAPCTSVDTVRSIVRAVCAAWRCGSFPTYYYCRCCCPRCCFP